MQYIDDNRNDSLNVRVPYRLKIKLKEYAQFQELSLSELIVRMLAENIGQAQYREWVDTTPKDEK